MTALVEWKPPALDFEAACVWIKEEGWIDKRWVVWVQLVPSQAQLRIINGSGDNYGYGTALERYPVFFLPDGSKICANTIFEGGSRWNSSKSDYDRYHSWLKVCDLRWRAELIAKNAREGIQEYRAAIVREWARQNPPPTRLVSSWRGDAEDDAKNERIRRALSDEA